MSAEVLYKGPQPPENRIWCFACAHLWKGTVNERYALTIEQALKAPDGSDAVWIDTTQDEGLPHLEVAVATGLYGPLADRGPLLLCWSHLVAINFQTASGLQLPVPGMGGFPGMNGMGGR